MQHVADLRTGIQQHREGPFTSDEGLIEAGRPGQDRAPAGHPPARPVHQPFQEPFPPAHRDGRPASGRQNLTPGRHLEMPQVVKPAQEGRKKPAPPWFIQVFQEQPEVTLGDRVSPAQRVTHLQHPGHGQVRSGERHRLLVPGEVFAVPAEPGDQVRSVKPERKCPGPVAPAKVGDVACPALVPLIKEPGRLLEPDTPARHVTTPRAGTARHGDGTALAPRTQPSARAQDSGSSRRQRKPISLPDPPGRSGPSRPCQRRQLSGRPGLACGSVPSSWRRAAHMPMGIRTRPKPAETAPRQVNPGNVTYRW